MLKLHTTSYVHLFNILNFNIFVHKSRSNARGIQLVQTDSGGPLSFMAFRVHMREVLAVIRHTSHPRYLDSAQNRNFRKNM